MTPCKSLYAILPETSKTTTLLPKQKRGVRYASSPLLMLYLLVNAVHSPCYRTSFSTDITFVQPLPSYISYRISTNSLNLNFLGPQITITALQSRNSHLCSIQNPEFEFCYTFCTSSINLTLNFSNFTIFFISPFRPLHLTKDFSLIV